MYKGSHPTTMRRHSCHLCAAVEKKLLTPPNSKPKEHQKASKNSRKLPPLQRPAKRPLQITNKIPRTDIFQDQEGGGRVQLIAPVRAAVEQAKALLRRKRKCRRKGCRQAGARAKVYNPNRRRRPKRTKSKQRRYRRHGRK